MKDYNEKISLLSDIFNLNDSKISALLGISRQSVREKRLRIGSSKFLEKDFIIILDYSRKRFDILNSFLKKC